MNLIEISWLLILTVLLIYVFIRLTKGQNKIETDITFLLMLMTDNKKAKKMLGEFMKYFEKRI